MRPTILLAAVLGALMSPVATRAQGGGLPEHIRLIQPPTEAPSPLVAWASGCSGFFHPRAPWHFVERAQHLLSSGYAVAYVDFIAAAGHETACAGELSLPAIGRVLLDAVRVLGDRPEIDANRIVLLGGSLGGGGVLAALSSLNADSPKLAAVLVLYPACEGAGAWSQPIPVWIWFAGGDQITPPSGCDDLLDQVEGPLFVHTYPGVQHAFDMRGLPTELEPGEAAIALDPAAAEDLWRRIERVLVEIRQGN